MELEPIKKIDAFGCVKKFFTQYEATHGVKTKAFRSDNGEEFMPTANAGARSRAPAVFPTGPAGP